MPVLKVSRAWAPAQAGQPPSACRVEASQVHQVGAHLEQWLLWLCWWAFCPGCPSGLCLSSKTTRMPGPKEGEGRLLVGVRGELLVCPSRSGAAGPTWVPGLGSVLSGQPPEQPWWGGWSGLGFGQYWGQTQACPSQASAVPLSHSPARLGHSPLLGSAGCATQEQRDLNSRWDGQGHGDWFFVPTSNDRSVTPEHPLKSLIGHSQCQELSTGSH